MVIGVWTFAIILLVGMLILQADMLVALMLFFVAILVSVLATALPTKSATETKPATK